MGVRACVADVTSEGFQTATDAILIGMRTRAYAETLTLIDELEEAAKASLDARQVAISCADLRFDAALDVGRPLGECRALYESLCSLGLDPQMELMKSVIFANSVNEERLVVEAYVRPAEQRARSASVPPSLLAAAHALISKSDSGDS